MEEQLRQLKEKYRELSEQRYAGRISDAEFREQLNAAGVEDPEAPGCWWNIGVYTGRWIYFNGTRWLERTPEGFGPVAGTPPAAELPVQVSSGISGWMWVIVAVVPALFILYIIGSIAIPSMLNAMDRGKQMDTVENISRIGQSVEQYLMDHRMAPRVDDIRELQEILDEVGIRYVNREMIKDGWGHDLIYIHSGIRTYTVMSLGRDSAFGPDVTPNSRGYRIVMHFDEDIIWSMGRFIQRPEGAQTY